MIETRADFDLPQAVTFDCWSTLLSEEDWGLAHQRRIEALAEAAQQAGASPDEEKVEEAFRLAWGRHMQLWAEGVATGASHVAGWAMETLGVATDGRPLRALCRHFEEASHSGRVVALDGARETLDSLAERGVRMALICDTGLTPGRVVRQHLGRLGLLSSLSAQLFSDEFGVTKPDTQIFAAALDALAVPARYAVHVGDLRRTDVAGARAMGMRSVRIRARHDDETDLPEADHVVDSHAELLSVLTGGLPGRE
ncbi:MAG: HAD family hydrolase [Deltaproteobacteria bacterium]|nr:HAD family hydrolase [Deltaproteobacteria bacterium]MBW2394278.1 HAD family hydrolase [Deltaproteobacteria bacterium]